MKEVNVNVIRGACIGSSVFPAQKVRNVYSWLMHVLLTANTSKL